MDRSSVTGMRAMDCICSVSSACSLASSGAPLRRSIGSSRVDFTSLSLTLTVSDELVDTG